jgi:hypothetical protein
MRRSFAAFGLLAAALAIPGCILFVNDDPSNLGPTCDFQGQDTACGKCVLSACSAQLDACCIDSTCKSSLSDLDDCVGNADPGGCQDLSGSAPTLGACIQSACASCNLGDGGGGADGSTGSTNCSKTGDSCFCTVGSLDEPPNGVVCTPATVAPGLCCADYGWPKATDAQCTCEPFSCTPDSTGAICSLTSNSTQTTSWSGGACCGLGTDCICDSTTDSCPGTEQQYYACTVAAITCDSSQVSVSSCSF